MNSKCLSILLLYLFCLILGFCIPAFAEQNPITTEPAIAASSGMDSIPQNQTRSTSLTLEEAVITALKYNPTLTVFVEEIRARDAAALQAGLLPNPVLSVEMENFAGQDELQGIDGAETTIGISQLIELGGKRNNRRQEATLKKDLAEWDYQSKKLDVLAATTKAFFQVLVAQEQVALNDELVKLAEKTHAAVSERVDAGKVSPMESTRTHVELAAARSEENRTQHELEVTRQRLVSLWGAERIEFDRVDGNLEEITPLSSKETIQVLLDRNPDLTRWKSELERQETAVALARSQAVPDITLNFGVRNFQETNDNALVAGIEIPLPLFDRNQGGVGEARANLLKARQEQRAAEVTMRAGLSETWQYLSAAYVETAVLRDEILPGALSAFEATKLGYSEGKLDFLQMLDAQRTLFTVKRQYLLALEAYHMAVTDVERLIALPLKNLLEATTIRTIKGVHKDEN